MLDTRREFMEKFGLLVGATILPAKDLLAAPVLAQPTRLGHYGISSIVIHTYFDLHWEHIRGSLTAPPGPLIIDTSISFYSTPDLKQATSIQLTGSSKLLSYNPNSAEQYSYSINDGQLKDAMFYIDNIHIPFDKLEFGQEYDIVIKLNAYSHLLLDKQTYLEKGYDPQVQLFDAAIRMEIYKHGWRTKRV